MNADLSFPDHSCCGFRRVPDRPAIVWRDLYQQLVDRTATIAQFLMKGSGGVAP